MKFVKWRTMWAWGYTQWGWMILPDNFKPKDVRAVMEAKAESEGGHSDKFRKIEWVVAKNPPLEVMEEKFRESVRGVEDAKNLVKSFQRKRDELRQLITARKAASSDE